MRFFIIMTILFTFSAPVHSDEMITFSMRKMWTIAPRHQKDIAALDSLYQHWHTTLIQDQNTNYVPIDTLQFSLGAAILDDFVTAHHPLSLLDVKQKYNVDVLLFLFPDLGKDLKIKVDAISFPSGSFLASEVIKVDRNNLFKSSLDNFIKHVKSMRTAFGFPFHHSEKGVLFSSSKSFDAKTGFCNGAYAAQKMADSNNSTTCRFKLVDVTEQTNPDSLLSYLNGTTLIRGNSRDTAHILFSYPFSDTGFGELPFWPDLKTLREYTISLDSAYVVHLCTAVSPASARLIELQKAISSEMTNDTGSLAWQMSVTLHKNATAHEVDSLKAAVLHTVYQHLIEFFPDQLSQGWAKLNYAEFCMNQGDVEKALHLFETAESEFARLGEDRPFFLAARFSGEIYEKLEMWQQAEKAYRHAVEVSYALHKDSLSADLYKRIGKVIEKQNEPLQAWSYYELSKDSYLAYKDSLNAARMFGEMGRIMRETGQLKKSSEYLTTFVNLADKLGDTHELAKAYYSQAQTALEMEKNEQALESLWSAGDKMELLGDTIRLADVEEQLGQLYMKMEHNRQAETRFFSALNLYESQADTSGMVRCLVWLGRMAASENLSDNARQFYQKAANFLDQSPAVSDEVKAQLFYHRALLYRNQGLYHQAFKDVQHVNKILPPFNPEKVDELRKELEKKIEMSEEK